MSLGRIFPLAWTGVRPLGGCGWVLVAFEPLSLLTFGARGSSCRRVYLLVRSLWHYFLRVLQGVDPNRPKEKFLKVLRKGTSLFKWVVVRKWYSRAYDGKPSPGAARGDRRQTKHESLFPLPLVFPGEH